MATLSRDLRRKLESVVADARDVAEEAAAKALDALAVGQAKAHGSMTEPQKALRNRLRAHGRQLGDGRNTEKGTQELNYLITECAYEHWHRMLFARFLSENQLLIEPESDVPITIEEVKEWARERGQDWVALAGEFAVRMLPQVFRQDDPVLEIAFAPEDRKRLEDLLESLSPEAFIASDSLGWCYQFWQSKRKDQINASGNKIGAAELPAVTQLFTEDYMVDFLLDNTLGAWHAGKVLAGKPKLAESTQSEDGLRQAVALPDCQWKYLRFAKDKEGRWAPAAGTFDDWPKTAKELKCLDPCMGSGHFVVAMFERLVALRMADEELDVETTVAAVIRDNLFGLEIDPRCTQIGAFNLALAAWRRVGHCRLPAMNLACSGLAPNARDSDWLAIARDNQKLQRGMERLYRLFKNAPVLGSLVNPRAGEADLLDAAFPELRPLLEKALVQEDENDTTHELAVTARGLAMAAEILAGQFTLVATNVPYLGRGKQDDILKEYSERVYPESKADLANCFVERCLEFCAMSGSTALVVPQNWLFLASYVELRQKLLKHGKWNWIAALGAKAFQTPMWDFNVMLLCISRNQPSIGQTILGIDVAEYGAADDKANALLKESLLYLDQRGQLANPGSKVVIGLLVKADPLGRHAVSYQGLKTGDDGRFRAVFWELPAMIAPWRFFQSTVPAVTPFAGRESILRYDDDGAAIARNQGKAAWGKLGVAISQMASLPATLYLGDPFDSNVAPIIPREVRLLPALWAFCSSTEFVQQVRQLDAKVAVANGTFAQVPFDLAHWQKVAADEYPHGLPKPSSNDPTQWLFNGHPAGADQALHVAVARLLGYQWPRQTGSSFPDCPALGPDGLGQLADKDGIVAISPARGEGPATERLGEVLASAYGKDWNATRQEELLAEVDYRGASLEDWLRDGLFEQHCDIFHQRPFVWHVWDGERDGFHAFVNYHKLVAPDGEGRKTLEKLTYSYLGDWIARHKAEQKQGKEGADAKLAAALHLQGQLKRILEGEPPYDLFIRWKPLHEQAIGWEPDINDGVRMNIRPFMMAKTLNGKSIFRKTPKIKKWDKMDGGKEPKRPKQDFPWFWGRDEETTDFRGGSDFDGNRWNNLHYSIKMKREARERQKEKGR
jgi:hypothetical protein